MGVYARRFCVGVFLRSAMPSFVSTIRSSNVSSAFSLILSTDKRALSYILHFFPLRKRDAMRDTWLKSPGRLDVWAQMQYWRYYFIGLD